MAKRKSVKVRIAVQDHDGTPTPERIKRANGGIESRVTESGRTGFRATDCDILNHLASRKIIDSDQFQSGEKYHKAWYNAGMAASGVVDPFRVIVDGGNPEPAAAARLEALGEWASATKAIGPTLAHPLVNMILLEETATVYAMRYMGKRDPKDARLAAYVALGLALNALVDHYLGPRRQRSRYHMDDGARPIIMPDRAA
jgi:hypothetical protein